MTSSWCHVIKLSVVCTVFLVLLLLLGWTYFTLRSQLQQLRTDVDQLRAVAAAAGRRIHGNEEDEVLVQRRSRRHDATTGFNESDTDHTTSNDTDSDHLAGAGSGELEDTHDSNLQHPRGIWMGTYSRVPVRQNIIRR